MRKIEFIKPHVVICLLLIVEYLNKHKVDRKIVIIPPSNKDVLEYLYKIDLPNALNSLCEFKIPKFQGSTIQINPVIPVKRFNSIQDIETIGNDMQMIFHSKLPELSSLFGSCHIIFSELADNIISHAQSSGGFVLAQQYNYRTGPLVEIAICDCGIGIPNSLKKNPKYAQIIDNDTSAIKLALKEGVSSIQDDLRGYGLHEVKNLMSVGNKILSIRSSSGYGVVKGIVEDYNEFGYCKYLPGCLAHVIMPTG
ncbi:hypothetical protein [Dehalococcoides mccartyi]|nr:hypothetical protein [Dehalococcoides mccartyi]